MHPNHVPEPYHVYVYTRYHVYVYRTMCIVASLSLYPSLRPSLVFYFSLNVRCALAFRRSCGKSDRSSGLKPSVRPQCTSTACLMIPVASCTWVLVHTPFSVSVVPDSAWMITPDPSRPGVPEILPRKSTTKFAL